MSMVRVAIALTCALAVSASTATASRDPIVRANGQIGPFRIDVTTEAQLRAIGGEPSNVKNQFIPSKEAPVGHTLYYRCGSGCLTAYSFNNTTRRLSDFWTRSPRFRTERGSYAGMSASRAASREQRELVPGCGEGLFIHIRWDARHAYVLTVARGKVNGITYLGPHSVYYEGLC